jgi:hypothetical protein
MNGFAIVSLIAGGVLTALSEVPQRCSADSSDRRYTAMG